MLNFRRVVFTWGKVVDWRQSVACSMSAFVGGQGGQQKLTFLVNFFGGKYPKAVFLGTTTATL